MYPETATVGGSLHHSMQTPHLYSTLESLGRSVRSLDRGLAVLAACHIT